MALKENPFYLLKLPCTAGRREIASAVEDMSFVLDAGTCSSAQSELTIMSKRITAEIDWFMETDERVMDQIRSCIEHDEPISLDDLSPLSALNAALHNFSLPSKADPSVLGDAIIDLSRKFSALHVEEITEAINRNRTVATLQPVQAKDVSAELNKKSKEIRRRITDKLASLDQSAYVQLMTMLAETCLTKGSCDDGVIISDALDQYEVRIQSVLEAQTKELETYIGKIKAMSGKASIPAEIDRFISKVKAWDKLAQPMQLSAQARGMPHQLSSRLLDKLRELIYSLHNDKNLTQEALKLISAMKSVFAELGLLTDLLEKDYKILKEIQEITEAFNAINRDIMLVKSHPTESTVAEYINHIKKLNQRIKASKMNQAAKQSNYHALFLQGTILANDLRYIAPSKNFSSIIRSVLKEEFGNISLPPTAAALRTTTIAPRKRSVSETPIIKGCVKFFFIIVTLLSIIGTLSNSCAPNHSSNTSTYRQSTYYTARPTRSQTAKPSGEPTAKPTAIPGEKLYSASSTIDDNIFLNIVLIKPMHHYTIGTPVETYPGIIKSIAVPILTICECTTDTGETVWISFDLGRLMNYPDFRSDLMNPSYFMGKERQMTFSPAARIHGKIVGTDAVAGDLSDIINQTSVIRFYSIDIPEPIQ